MRPTGRFSSPLWAQVHLNLTILDSPIKAQNTVNKRSTCLRVYMAQLRRKLETDPAWPRHLRTEPGVGYRLISE
jgi:DNA-binding response OmpR family regulator